MISKPQSTKVSIRLSKLERLGRSCKGKRVLAFVESSPTLLNVKSLVFVSPIHPWCHATALDYMSWQPPVMLFGQTGLGHCLSPITS